MYQVITLIFTVILFVGLAFIVPFYGPVRRAILSKVDRYDLLWDLLTPIERGSDSLAKSFLIFLAWSAIALMLFPAALAVSMMWPLVLALLVFGLFFHKIMVRNRQNQKNP